MQCGSGQESWLRQLRGSPLEEGIFQGYFGAKDGTSCMWYILGGCSEVLCHRNPGLEDILVIIIWRTWGPEWVTSKVEADLELRSRSNMFLVFWLPFSLYHRIQRCLPLPCSQLPALCTWACPLPPVHTGQGWHSSGYQRLPQSPLGWHYGNGHTMQTPEPKLQRQIDIP